MPTSKEERIEGWVSVTEILDAFIPKGLLSWYLRTGAKEAKRLSTVAMKIGSRVDELIQTDITTGSYKISAKDPIEVTNCMDAWKQFKQDYSPNITGVQIEVKSEEEKLVGHIDIIFNNRVVDVKCASSIKPNYWLQVSKYADMSKMPLKGVAILRLDKNLGTYQYVEKDGWQDVVIFDALLKAYRYYQPKGQEE